MTKKTAHNLHDEIVLVGISGMIYPSDHEQKMKKRKEIEKRKLTGKLEKREWGRGEK